MNIPVWAIIVSVLVFGIVILAAVVLGVCIGMKKLRPRLTKDKFKDVQYSDELQLVEK